MSGVSGVLVPGEDVLAGIRVNHGSKLRDHDPVGADVPLVGFTLQELAPVRHLTWNNNNNSECSVPQPPPGK